jgi:hypothetical protein
MNIREYWQGVRRIADTLPETVIVMSLDKPERGTTAGQVSECDRDTAARLIFAGTHRQATDAEVEQYKAAQAEIRKSILKAEYERKQQFALPEEVSNLIKAAVVRSQQEPERKRG